MAHFQLPFFYQSWLKVLSWIVGPVFASPLGASKENIVQVTKIAVWHFERPRIKEFFIDLLHKYLLITFSVGHANATNKS